MVFPTLTFALLSLLSTCTTAQDADPNTLPNNTLPAANLTSDPLNRNLTAVEIPLNPSFTNETTQGEEVIQTVAYFPAPGLDADLAIIHGDIILSTVPDLLLNADPANSSSTPESRRAKRSLSIFKYQNVWPGGIVNYKWQSESAKGLGRIEAWTEATQRWTNMLPWLKFKEFTPNDTLVDDVLTLVPTTGQFACFSPIGKAYGAYANQMMLDDQCGGAGTYAHELGHSKSSTPS